MKTLTNVHQGMLSRGGPNPESVVEGVEATSIDRPWPNGICLKKIAKGYTWTISVAAPGPGVSMEQALEQAVKLDRRLTELYPEQPADEDDAPKRRFR